jgi:hypothetical protein
MTDQVMSKGTKKGGMEMKREEIEVKIGKVWNTDELRKDFDVVGFSLGCCVVKDKQTGKRGSLDFDRFEVEGVGATRLYYGFIEG